MFGLRSGIRLPVAPAEPPQVLPPQPRVHIPLLWEETPLIRLGESVKIGQKLADGAGDTVPVHASIAGVVTAIAPRPCHDGKRHNTITVENDGSAVWDPAIVPRALLDGLDDEALLTQLFEAGIREPDGQPLAAKVAAMGQPIGTLIVCGIDPEPCQPVEDAAVRFDAEHVLGGIRLLQRLLMPQNTVIALAAYQKAAINLTSRWIGRALRLGIAPDAYPLAEPELLARMLGEVEDGKSLTESGILILSATSAAQCSRAIYDGAPVVEQTVCVTGKTGNQLLKVPLGTPVEEVLRAAGRQDEKVVLGGPMMGQAWEDLSVPVTKGMTGLSMFQELPQTAQTACIRCGKCAQVCPVGLRPYAAERRNGYEWRACIRCGACQYSCPAGRSLMAVLERKGREVASVG